MLDSARWSDPLNYAPDWKQRGRIIAQYLHGCRRVADMGAGTHALRALLRCDYLPVDGVALKPGTVLADFDGEWPVDVLDGCDGIAVAGLLEHLADPARFIRQIAPFGSVWAVSYMDAAKHKHPLLSLADLEALFADAGMRVTDGMIWRHQRVYRLVRC